MSTYTSNIKIEHKKNPRDFFKKLRKHQELINSLVSGAIILLAAVASLPYPITVVLFIVAFLIGGYYQAKEGILDTIEHKDLNVELLMIIAAVGSASIGYWAEGAILIFIFSLAGALETYTLNKSETEISSLMNLQPEEAHVIDQDGSMKTIPVSKLAIGNTVFVRASERIPTDGNIIKGGTSVDESAITGESLPVKKDIDDEVLAGTVALDGSIHIRVTKQPNETLFQKIINMVQIAKDEKSPSQLFIEKFEGTYVKVVLTTVAIMMFLPYLAFGWSLTDSIYRAMILLVVASPCALVASIMPATLSAITQSAKAGVLFKGGVHTEMMSKVNTIAFDKTGTLTNGTPVVTDIVIHPDYNKEELLSIVRTIEMESTHPLATAITTYNAQYTESKLEVDHIKVISGYGVTGSYLNEDWYIGKEHFSTGNSNIFEDEAITWGEQGKTIVYVAHKKRIVAIYALKDTIRKEAKQAIAKLKEYNIETMMLTGDNERTAKAVAEEIGIDTYTSECLPDKKVKQIKHLMDGNKKVAMIGDGINDAPALATADIGIAMGAGTDVAMETSDMVLMKNDLTKVVNAINLSKRMNRIIKQNIFFSLAVITALIFSNFFQIIDLPLGVIGHEGSTILVILNGLRLLK